MNKADGDRIYKLGIVKPSARGAASHRLLMDMLPANVSASARYAPIQEGRLDEFMNVLGFYEQAAEELAKEKPDILHLEGTPPFLILGHEGERRLVAEWQSRFGAQVFTSAMCQANALRALGAHRIVDAGYDPTTGPEAERYFTAAGFDVLAVEKAPVAWTAPGDIDEDIAFDFLMGALQRHPQADALCLQGSGKWRLTGLVERLEQASGVPVVHPVGARYWEIMTRLGLEGPQPGMGRLVREMPPMVAQVAAQ